MPLGWRLLPLHAPDQQLDRHLGDALHGLRQGAKRRRKRNASRQVITSHHCHIGGYPQSIVAQLAQGPVCRLIIRGDQSVKPMARRDILIQRPG